MASVCDGPQQPTEKGVLVENEQPPELFRQSKVKYITLLVEGKELHFAKYPLMEGSNVFTHMIENSADQSRLQLNNVAYKDIILFLECLHPRKLQAITDSNLEGVVTIAQTFHHEGILAKCEEYITQQLKKNGKTRDGMYDLFFFHLKTAEKCGLKGALEVGLSSAQLQRAYYFSQERGDSVTHTPITGYEDNICFCELSSETKLKILTNRLKIAERKIDPRNPY